MDKERYPRIPKAKAKAISFSADVAFVDIISVKLTI